MKCLLYASSAAATLIKDKRINIRLSSRDLEDVQTRAAEEGMPYQTLIAGVLHKYMSVGDLLKLHRVQQCAQPDARKNCALVNTETVR